MSISLQEHNQKKAVIRQEKSLKCREVFVRHDGDTQKVADEFGVSKCTIAEWLKPYRDDEEITCIKKQRRKDLSNTPEAKETS
jgi:transposase